VPGDYPSLVLGRCCVLWITPDTAAHDSLRSFVSHARAEWLTKRSNRIDELVSAHAMVRQPGPGGQWRTGQINAAIVVRVAVEFQGYSRDLHDEAVDHMANHLTATSGAIASVFRSSLTLNRALDKVNAQPSSLGSDFGRLGMAFWPALKAAFPATAGYWHTELETLNEARNGLAHHDEAKLRSVADAGSPTGQLATARRFRRSMNNLVGGIDTVVGNHLQSLIGGPPPW
jgi:hypothetical protein